MCDHPAGGLAPPFAMGLKVLALVIAGIPSPASADEIQTVELPVELPSSAAPPSDPTLGDLLRGVFLEALSEQYVDETRWGGTVQRFDGFRVRGFDISPRRKLVNHGFWQRYTARLLRPEKTFDVQIRQEESADPGIIPFSLRMTLPVRCEATYVLWTYGVKGLNGSSVCDATLKVLILLETSPKLSFSLKNPLPRLELRPRVGTVDFRLADITVQHFGLVDGQLAAALGDGSRLVVERFLQQQAGKFRKTLQARIDAAVGTNSRE